MMMANTKRSYNNYFIDPETLIEKSEIINKKIINEEENAKKNNLQQIKYDNDAIIEIDTDTTDTENSNNSYQSEFEKVIYKSEVTLEVLKEVPHDDKENIICSTFNEFGKRGRGRPKENKPKKRKTTENINSSEPSTAPKTFNISLGFLGSKSKITRDKSKTKLKNSIKSEPDDFNNDEIKESTTKIVKKRGRTKQKQCLPHNKSITKNTDINKTVHLTSLTDCKNESDDNNSDNGLSIPVNNYIDSQENSINTSSTQINGENHNTILPIKKKRGRPCGTFKIKDAKRNLKKKKLTGQKGRPLLSDRIIEIKPKGRRGRPFTLNKPPIPNNNDNNKIKQKKPGRPSLGLKKIKKYDKRGRPPGPPKPIKIPGTRGRKRNPDSPPKKPKIPGRGRGRPSFASLKEVKPEIKNKSELEMEKNQQEQEQNDSSSNDSESDSESENNLNISSPKSIINQNDDENNIKKADFDENNIKDIDIIETISLASSSDTNNDEYDNKSSISNIDDDDNSADSEIGYFTVAEDNISKVEVQLEYMFREEKTILQKHYI